MLSLVQNVHIARHGEYDEIHSEDLLCTGAYWFEILLRANRFSLDWFYKQNHSDGMVAFALWKVKGFCLYEHCEGVLFCYNKGWTLVQTWCHKCRKCLFFCFRYIIYHWHKIYHYVRGHILRDEDANVGGISIKFASLQGHEKVLFVFTNAMYYSSMTLRAKITLSVRPNVFESLWKSLSLQFKSI